MSPAEQAALRGRAINGDKAALKEWLALPKAKKPEPKLPAEPAQPAEEEEAPELEEKQPQPKKGKKE